MKDLHRELSKMIVVPVIVPLDVCRGHLDLDNRGVRPEEYNEKVRKVFNRFGSNKHMASAALAIFTRGHTMRIDAEELRNTSFSLSPTGLVLIGEQAVRLPFQRSLVGSLTVVLNAGSLSSSNTQTFADLTNSIDHIALCFPKLRTLTIDIEWKIDEVEERFAPLYTFLLEHGQAKASNLPLANIRGAHKTCQNFFKLVCELHYFHCNIDDCDIRILTKGKQMWFDGDWDYDIVVAGWLFPNSYIWRTSGFQDWVRDCTMIHYGPEGEVVAIEVLHRESDDKRISEEYNYP